MGIVIEDEETKGLVLIPNVNDILWVAGNPKTKMGCLIRFKGSDEPVKLDCDFHYLADMIRKAQTCKED